MMRVLPVREYVQNWAHARESQVDESPGSGTGVFRHTGCNRGMTLWALPTKAVSGPVSLSS